MTVLFATEWPTEVWAVEYTNICNKRVVEVMADLVTAQLFIDNVNSNYWAEPVLLRSEAKFFPASPIAYGPDHTADAPKNVRRQRAPFKSATGVKRKYARHAGENRSQNGHPEEPKVAALIAKHREGGNTTSSSRAKR
jgi:hypothetical protein